MKTCKDENIDNEQAKILGENVRMARLLMKKKEPWDWSQEKTAEKLKMTQQGYQKIEAGKTSSPRRETLNKIATLFNTTVDFLFGRSSNSQPIEVYSELIPIDVPQPVGLIPVLTPEQVASNYIENGGKLDDLKLIPVYSKDELGCRAVVIESDSMFRPHEEGLSVEKGAIVFYNPNKDPRNGDLVIVKFNGNDDVVYLRQFLNEGGTKGFKPFNPAFAFTLYNDSSNIYGVAYRKMVDF